jgi:hypothetical protein
MKQLEYNVLKTMSPTSQILRNESKKDIHKNSVQKVIKCYWNKDLSKWKYIPHEFSLNQVTIMVSTKSQ